MKSIPLLLCCLFVSLFAKSQAITTMRLENQKDAWDETGTYIGEVKGGKPNGLGVFIYHNEVALRYAGYFTDGLPQGKGVLLLKNGAFIWGDWVKGKPGGKGANLTDRGDLYIGQFAEGVKSGFGSLIYKDNMIVQGNFKGDKLDGRVLNFDSEGKIVSDNFYRGDEKNGPGYQFELEGKKLFKGTWENGAWKGASEVPYKSFLTNPRFTAEQSSKHILIGCTNIDRMLHDTAFYRDNIKKKRYFGVYNNGYLAKGIVIREDTSVFLGQLNTNGATGYCTTFKKGKFFEEGIYVDDYLQGTANLSIDLEKKTVYYGGVTGKGIFTGNSWFCNSKNYLYRGNYLEGKLTGTGSRLDSLGYSTKGIWQEGTLQQLIQVTGPDGKPISMNPLTLNEALTQLVRLYNDNFSPVEGEELYDELLIDADYESKSFYKPLPGCKTSYLLEDDDGLAHLSVIYDLADENAAKAKYEALCKQLLAARVTPKAGSAPLSLTTKDLLTPDDPESSLTTFRLSPNTGKWWNDCSIMVIQVFDESSNTYKVMLGVGDIYAVESWLALF